MPVKLCDVPGCPFHGRYCRNHYPGDAPKPKQPIAKESANRKQENKTYNKVSKEVKSSGDGLCEIKSPVCIKGPVHPHHLQGRIGKRFTDKKKMIRACDPCNGYVVTYPEWAKQHGVVLSRHEKNYKREK